MRCVGRALLAAVLWAAPLQAQQRTIGPPRSLGSSTQTALQIAGGIAGAWVVGIGAWSVLDDVDAPDRKVKGDAGYQPNANTAYAVGSWVGSTLAVYAVGKAFDEDAGWLRGTAIGTGIVSAFLLLGRDEPYLPVIGLAVGAPLQAIAGTIGFGIGN